MRRVLVRIIGVAPVLVVLSVSYRVFGIVLGHQKSDPAVPWLAFRVVIIGGAINLILILIARRLSAR